MHTISDLIQIQKEEMGCSEQELWSCPSESPKERESLSYKRGHFEKQWEAQYNTISVLALSTAY